MTTLGAFELNQIYTGDARELAKGIPDESVDLIFTDPPYLKEMEQVYIGLGEYAPRILKPSGSLITVCGQHQLPMVIQSLSRLQFRWVGWLENKGWQRPTLFGFRVVCCGKPLLWFVKDKPKMYGFWWDLKSSEGGDKRFHEWGQSEGYAIKDVITFTDEQDIVLDPFCGGGTVPAVCKMLKRNYIAFEIDPPTAERARERVRNTQPPLFVLQPEQTEMELSA